MPLPPAVRWSPEAFLLQLEKSVGCSLVPFDRFTEVVFTIKIHPDVSTGGCLHYSPPPVSSVSAGGPVSVESASSAKWF